MQQNANPHAAHYHARSCAWAHGIQRQISTAARIGSHPAATVSRPLTTAPRRSRRQGSSRCLRVCAYQVEIEHDNGTTTLKVGEEQTILEAALENGLELSHDCKMGVCMTCPAKLEAGKVDQSAGMLDDEVKAKGYALLCVSTPKSDCKVRTIEEDELLAEVLQGG